jgi:GT2 family glycosyltransferase
LFRRLFSRLSRGSPQGSPQPVDVVIPVYRGLAETRACVESALASRGATPYDLIVVDDHTPEPQIARYLDALAREGRIRLLRHGQNRGFVASVNEGMALDPGRDVVLLNSDTEVAPGWLDRLAACARREPGIGTATPFSNNATICSYPRTLAANAIPAGETTATLDAAFAAANAGRCEDIVTAVGFCMYITRACLDRVGAFDLERYGAGYGEEVDFCMRARRAGFRNVACADVFVRHVGEVSFGEAGPGRRESAQATVDALYPEFQQMLARFIPADPLRGLRRRADLQRLRRAPGELAREAHGAGLKLGWNRPGEEFALWLDPARDREGLAAIERCLADPTAPLPELDARWLAEPLES